MPRAGGAAVDAHGDQQEYQMLQIEVYLWARRTPLRHHQSLEMSGPDLLRVGPRISVSVDLEGPGRTDQVGFPHAAHNAERRAPYPPGTV